MSIYTFTEYPYSYKNVECASFVLRTADATFSNQYSTSNTWRNINLRTLMGNEMYDKYDTFLLKPIVTATAQVSIPNWGGSTDDRYVCFNIQGLPFINNFNSSTMTKLPSAIFAINQNRISNMTSTSGGNTLTFGKFQELVDLTIFYSRVSPKTVGTYTNYITNPGTSAFPHFVFLFMIYGVKKQEENNKLILPNSMFNAESATLILRSADLPVDTAQGNLASNATGSTDNFLSSMTWNNINLRTLLGSMYEKYDRFALVPTQIQSVNSGASPGSTTDDRNLLIYVSGLPFINNTYDVSTKTNKNGACINFIRMVANGNAVASSNGNIVLFSKNQELVNLNIYYQRITKNAGGDYDPVSSAGNNYPHVIFGFNVYGVTATERVADPNGSRIF